MKTLGLLFFLLLPIGAALAGENVELDKTFSFRLGDDKDTAPPLALPPKEMPREQESSDTMKTPEGTVLPPGSRTQQFNGLPVYFIPLAS